MANRAPDPMLLLRAQTVSEQLSGPVKQRIASLFGVTLVGASISAGALVASGTGTEAQHNTPVAVNAAATTIGNAQPGVVIRGSVFAPVQTTTALSIQPGLPRPDASQRMALADIDLTALACAAAYDQCAAKAMAEVTAS